MFHWNNAWVEKRESIIHVPLEQRVGRKKEYVIHVPSEQRVGRKKRNKLFMFHRNNVWVGKLEFFVPSLKLLNKCFFQVRKKI